MFGFLIGTACLVGLIGLSGCRGRYRHHPPPHHHRRRGRRGRGPYVERAFSEMFKRRLDVDEDQSDLIDHAFTDLRGSLGDLKEVFADSRSDLADALRGEAVDEAAIDAVFARHDEAMKRARQRAVSAIKQIHAVLDPPQRDLAADWMAEAHTPWRTR